MIDPTHSPAWAHTLVETQRQFGNDLVAAGFAAVEPPGVFEGTLEVINLAGRPVTTELEVHIPDGFPFDPPKVIDSGMTSTHTWHHERDWGLCLYSRRNVGDRPWQRVDQLLARVQDWFTNAAAGWPDDPPDLDLERYFSPHAAFVTFDDIDNFVAKPISASERGKHRLHVDRLGYLPAQKRQRRKKRWGWVGELGELEAPVFDWVTVKDRLGTAADEVEKRIRNGGYEFLLLRYHRQTHTGVIALFPSVHNKKITLSAATCAANDPRTRRLRAGHPTIVRALAKRTVAIVGIGAVGSAVADLLSRAGIGDLHLVDFDLLRPGNCIRHLAGYQYIGWPKTDAVRDVLANRELLARDHIATTEARLTPALAAALIESADVVVDATADDNVRGLLAELCEQATEHRLPAAVVSVAVHRSGGIIRSDRFPRTSPGSPSPIPGHPDGELDVREGGCGDPVSTTPASSVIEAAGLATRHIVDRLTGRNALPQSIVDVLLPQPDAPYQVLGVVQT